MIQLMIEKTHRQAIFLFFSFSSEEKEPIGKECPPMEACQDSSVYSG